MAKNIFYHISSYINPSVVSFSCIFILWIKEKMIDECLREKNNKKSERKKESKFILRNLDM